MSNVLFYGGPSSYLLRGLFKFTVCHYKQKTTKMPQFWANFTVTL